MSEFDTKYKVYDYVVYDDKTYKVCNIYKSELDDGVMYELRRKDKYDDIVIEFEHEDSMYIGIDKGVKCPECNCVCNQLALVSDKFVCDTDECIVSEISEPYPDIDTVFEKQGESQN